MTEFNKFEALEMLETLQKKAADVKHDKKNYYWLVYQTVREKVNTPKDHFKNLVMLLLEDKDHEKIVDKVEKSHRKAPREGVTRGLRKPVRHACLINLVPRVLGLFGQRVSAWDNRFELYF